MDLRYPLLTFGAVCTMDIKPCTQSLVCVDDYLVTLHLTIPGFTDAHTSRSVVRDYPCWIGTGSKATGQIDHFWLRLHFSVCSDTIRALVHSDLWRWLPSLLWDVLDELISHLQRQVPYSLLQICTSSRKFGAVGVYHSWNACGGLQILASCIWSANGYFYRRPNFLTIGRSEFDGTSSSLNYSYIVVFTS